MLAEPIRVALRVGRALDDLEVPWIVGGSVASSIHGVPRATQDIDIVADLRRFHAAQLVRLLETEFYIDQEAVLDAILRRSSFNLVDLDSITKVDVFVPRGDRLSAAQLTRRQFVQVGDTVNETLPVLSAEDTVLQKLRWYDAGERVSERQWRDVLGVLKVRVGTLDLDYMTGQAQDAGLLELLRQALSDAS